MNVGDKRIGVVRGNKKEEEIAEKGEGERVLNNVKICSNASQYVHSFLGVETKPIDDSKNILKNEPTNLIKTDNRNVNKEDVLKVNSHSTSSFRIVHPTADELITPRQSFSYGKLFLEPDEKNVRDKGIADHNEERDKQDRGENQSEIITDDELKTKENDVKNLNSEPLHNQPKSEHLNQEANIANTLSNKAIVKSPASRKFTDTSNDDDICDWRLFTKASLLPYQFLSSFMNNDEVKVESTKEDQKSGPSTPSFNEQMTSKNPHRNTEMKNVMKKQAEIQQQLESQKKWIEDYSAVNIFNKENRSTKNVRAKVSVPPADQRISYGQDNQQTNFNQKLQFFEDRIGVLTKEIEILNRNLKHQYSPTLSDETLYREIKHETMEMKMRQLEYFHKLQYAEILQHCQEQFQAQQQQIAAVPRSYDKWAMWNYARYNARMPSKPYLSNHALYQDSSSRYNSIFQKERLQHIERLLNIEMQKLHNMEQQDRFFQHRKILQQDLKERVNGNGNIHPRFTFPQNADNFYRHPFNPSQMHPQNTINEQKIPPFGRMNHFPNIEANKHLIEHPSNLIGSNHYLYDSRMSSISSGSTSSRGTEAERSDLVGPAPLHDNRSGSEDSKSKFASCTKCHATAQFLCSACHQTWYCSRECQLIDWKLHSKTCKENNGTTMKRKVNMN